MKTRKADDICGTTHHRAGTNPCEICGKAFPTQSQHTPTPWMIRPDELQEGSFQIRHETPFYRDNMLVASVIARTVDNIAEEHGGSQEANAAFIVRAVNNFDEILRALKLAHQCLESLMSGDENDYDAHQKEIEQAIAKAEGI